MIIFYNKKTGDIVGSVDGRVHPASHMEIWVGSREDNGRIFCQWVKKGGTYEPSNNREVFLKLDKGEVKLEDLYVDTETKEVKTRNT